MNSIQVIKLVFGILLGVGTLVLAILTYFLGWKKWYVSEKKCTQSVQGEVVGYTLASRSKRVPVHLPIVEYIVDGKKYKVVGPKYQAVSTKRTQSPVTENGVQEFDPYDSVLRISTLRNSLMSFQGNPLAMVFPKGSKMMVYYNPNRPKEAYALRYLNEQWKFYLLLCTTILVFVTCICIELFL